MRLQICTVYLTC